MQKTCFSQKCNRTIDDVSGLDNDVITKRKQLKKCLELESLFDSCI